MPPVYVHETDRNYEKLFPILSYGREYLEEVTNEYFKATNGNRKYEYERRENYDPGYHVLKPLEFGDKGVVQHDESV